MGFASKLWLAQGKNKQTHAARTKQQVHIKVIITGDVYLNYPPEV